MAFRHYTLTLTGAAQRLSDVLFAPSSNKPAGSDPGALLDVPLKQIIFAAVPANANVVYVGGSNAVVSATSHAFSLDPTEATMSGPVTIGPFTDCGPLKLSDFYVLGTNAQLLAFGVVPY